MSKNNWSFQHSSILSGTCLVSILDISFYDTQTTWAKFHDDCKQYFRINYFEALDLIISSVKEKFDQPGYVIYKDLQDLLLMQSHKERRLWRLFHCCNQILWVWSEPYSTSASFKHSCYKFSTRKQKVCYHIWCERLHFEFVFAWTITDVRSWYSAAIAISYALNKRY